MIDNKLKFSRYIITNLNNFKFHVSCIKDDKLYFMLIRKTANHEIKFFHVYDMSACKIYSMSESGYYRFGFEYYHEMF